MSPVDESLAAAVPGETSLTTDERELANEYSYWQTRILIAATIGYALFYFVRKNLPVAMPVMIADLGISKFQLGKFITAHGVLYGISKFANGMLGDRLNARWFMVFGLVVSATLNIFFGLSTAVAALGVIWMLNGWFQGIGFPPCARLMTHWFPPQRLASKMGIWNMSHSLGTVVILLLCGYLAQRDWRLCFFVPGAIALVGAAWLAWALRDTPESLGLPPVAGTADGEHESESYGSSLQRLVFSNPHIWLLSFANFFVYTVRYGILDWGPTFLTEARGMHLSGATWMTAAFEGSGALGMLCGGWITDRVFGGRPARTCLVYMTLCTGALLLFWQLPNQTWVTSTVLLCLAGFFIYGPQSLIGTAAANLGTKRAAATAVGLTGLFGYLSTVVSGAGIGWLVERYNWDAGFMVFFASGAMGMLLFAACWTAKAHGYAVQNEIQDEM